MVDGADQVGQAEPGRQGEHGHVQEDHERVAAGGDGEEPDDRAERGQDGEQHAEAGGQEPGQVPDPEAGADQGAEHVERREGDGQGEQGQEGHLERVGGHLAGLGLGPPGQAEEVPMQTP